MQKNASAVAIELRQAVLCAVCETISVSRGDECAVCGERGGLVSLARVLGEGKPGAERLTDEQGQASLRLVGATFRWRAAGGVA